MEGDELMASPQTRILCTEDDADARDLIILILNDEGYEVICAENAKDALALVKAQKFDLYLLDNWLPDISGKDLTEKIRQFDSQTPILFYSAAGYERDKKNALRAGAQAYLVKPAHPEALVAEIARLIASNTNSLTN
jgi:DNA-binding response OmpR family regulator